MKSIGISLVLLAIIACAKDQVDAPVYVCRTDQVISYSAISSIITAKCATAGCHEASNNYIPHLVTQQEVTNNRSDCLFQINNGAMPPAQETALSADERAKILCWLQYGIN